MDLEILFKIVFVEDSILRIHRYLRNTREILATVLNFVFDTVGEQLESEISDIEEFKKCDRWK